MVFYRKRKSAYAVTSGRVAKKPRMTTKRVASIAKKAVMKASETKKHSLEVVETTLSTNGGIDVQYPLQLPGTSGQGGRVGHKVNPIGIDIRGHIITQAQGSATIARVMVVRLKDMAANPVTELLETNAGNVTASSNDISKMYRRLNTDSFEILSSKYINLTPNASGFNATRLFRMWVPLRKIRQLTYEGAAATNPNRNDVAIIVYAADAANDASNLLYEVSYNSTFYFKDP